MGALEPTTPTDLWNTRIGDFWKTTAWQTGQSMTHHAGQTGGYASYIGLDRTGHKAVIVLSDVANDASDLGSQLLANREYHCNKVWVVSGGNANASDRREPDMVPR